MKTLNWSGFFALPRRVESREPGTFTRFMALLTRGESPVDGLECRAKERDPDRNPEPVRWGNFR
jgi:hypothetical protein